MSYVDNTHHKNVGLDLVEHSVHSASEPVLLRSGEFPIVLHEKSLRRFREKVRALTAHDRGRSVESLVRELNIYMRGWWAYFRTGNTQNLTRPLNDWILRRLRAYVWTQWKLPRTKIRNLLACGVHPNWAKAMGNSRKGPWRMSKQSPLHQALPERYFTQTLGLALFG